MKRKIIYFFLSLAMITTITYFIYSIINSTRLTNQLTTIVSISTMSIFSIIFVIISMANNNIKSEKYIIIGSILLTFYSGFNILTNSQIIKLPEQSHVINFTNKAVTEAIKWAKSNNVEIEQLYENSDNYDPYTVISQSVSPGTLVKNVDKLTVVVSSGPSLEKEVMVPSFIGWSFDEVMKFIELNYLNNVLVDFEVSDSSRDTVIAQEGSGYLKRNDQIKIVFSIGNIDDIVPKEIEDFNGKSLFYSTTWLKRYAFNYELDYQYSDKVAKGLIISQSISGKVADPNSDVIKLVVSKGNKITMINLLKMDVEEITTWIINNNLKVVFEDRYDDNVKLGYPISANYKEGDELEEGTTVKLVISKGQIKMPKINNINEFIAWATKYNVKVEQVYEFNEKINNGEIIRVSHEENSVIKNDDIVTIYISQGTPVTIPNFVGMKKADITKKCNELGITCNFVYGRLTESTQKDIAISQSKTKGAQIVKGTSISITLSSGVYVKVNVPSFVGMTKSEITNRCNNLKITCNFTYQTNFSSTPRDQAVSQNKSGTMNQGSAINIVLSRGPAREYSIVIDAASFYSPDPNVSKAALKEKLEAACPGVNFVYSFVKVHTGIGLINPSSDVKVGHNVLVEGRTYKVIINS